MDSKDLIRVIRQEYGLDIDIDNVLARSAVENLTRNLERAARNLSEELYTKSTHFILEFIQNADDNTYLTEQTPTLEMKLDGEGMTIWSNEVGFSERNVRAICSIGASTKKDRSQGFIGEKGIGFKSVFTVADVVKINSAGYAFKFDKREPLGMIAPIPLDNGDVAWAQHGTTFRLQLSSGVQHGDLVSRLQEIKPALLLFLRKVECINIMVDGATLAVERSHMNNGITRVLRTNSISGASSDYYLISKYSVETSMGEEKREGISHSDIVLAFPVSESEDPIISKQDVHAFLALRSFGFPFIIQADFLTASSREDILVDRKWNQVLRDAISAAFMEAIKTLQQRRALKHTWIRYIPSDIPDPFFRAMCTKLLQQLKASPIIICRDEISRRPSEVIILPSSYQDEDGQPLIPKKYVKSKSYLSPAYDVSEDATILQTLGVETMSGRKFLDGLALMERDGSLFVQSETWWESVCSALREFWRSSDKKLIRRLKLVPLVDGTWASVSMGVFFDFSSASDVPQDLELRLVKHLDRNTSHYKLLDGLGVQKAEYHTVVELLKTLHSSVAGGLKRHRSNLPCHAWFLFRHRHEEVSARSFPLKIVTQNSSILPASEIYMDHPRHHSPSLSSCLQQYGASFLHADYNANRWTTSFKEADEWRDWLHGDMKINIAPRIAKYSFSTLPPELRGFLESAKSASLLAFLKEYASDIMNDLKASSGALQELRAISVVTRDGVERPLETTYIPRRSLLRYQDLPFLDIRDPESHDWDFLKELGVSFQVDGRFYLKQLIRLSERSQLGERTLTNAIDCYQQLGARFNDDDDEARAIGTAFKERRLIYVPARLGEAVSGRWISSSDAVWDGPRCMRLRFALQVTYPTLQKFFCDQVNIPGCPNDILFQELREISHNYRDKPLDDAIHQRVHDILCDLSDITSTLPYAVAESPAWLTQLQRIAFIPVELPMVTEEQEKEVWLKSLDDKFYIPDLDGFLARLFNNLVPMLTLPPEKSRGRIEYLHSLFKTKWFHRAQFLHTAVKKKIADQETTRIPHVDLSKHYLERVPFLARTVRDSRLEQSARASLRQLEDIGVYNVQSASVIHTYSLAGKVCKEESPLGIEVIDNRCIILLGSSCKEDERDIMVCCELERLFPAFNMQNILLVFTQSIPAINTMFPPDDVSIRLADLEDETRASWFNRASCGPSYNTNDIGGSSVVVGQRRASRHRKLTLTVENELREMLASDISRLRAVAGKQSLSAATLNMEYLERGFEKIMVSGVQSLYNSDDGSSSERTITPSCGRGAQQLSSEDIIAALNRVRSGAGSQATGHQEYAGILGEIYAYQVFEQNLPNFNFTNWTSSLRKHMGFDAFVEVSVADFQYEDSLGVLTEMLFGTAQKEKWHPQFPTYHLEVKSSSDAAGAPFHINSRQLQLASKMSLRNLEAPEAVYVLVRVSRVRASQPTMVMYPDLWRSLYNCSLEIVSDVEIAIST